MNVALVLDFIRNRPRVGGFVDTYYSSPWTFVRARASG